MSHTCQFQFPGAEGFNISAIQTSEPVQSTGNAGETFPNGAALHKQTRTETTASIPSNRTAAPAPLTGTVGDTFSNAECGVRSAELKGTIIDAARRMVVRDIIKLLSDDLKDARAHQHYLESLSLEQLDARRKQLREEIQREFRFSEKGTQRSAK